MVIEVNELVKKFGDFTAVDHITFDVKEGEIFGFLGANGAGKTTAMKMLCGLLKPSGGSGTVAGVDITSKPERIKKHIGYMSQRFSLYEDLTCEENIMFYGGIYGLRKKELKEKSSALISKLGLEDVKDDLLKSLPLGWKQKLAFSVALLHDPQVIFLDEPTGGVDPLTRRQFWELMYETASQGKTIFVTTHYMDEAEYCNRVSIMVNGRIDAMGSPQNLKKDFNVTTMDEVFLKLARQ